MLTITFPAVNMVTIILLPWSHLGEEQGKRKWETTGLNSVVRQLCEKQNENQVFCLSFLV